MPAIGALRQGNDAPWVRTDLPGAGDAALLDIAEADSRVPLTLDKDSWQLAIQRCKSLEHSGVIPFRVQPTIPANITPLVLRTMATDQNWDGHASVVGSDHVLMTQSPRPEAK